jgi:hypothetical protein
MIDDRATAKSIMDSLMQVSGIVDDSILLVQNSCPEPDFRRYRRKMAKVLGEIFDVVYAIHAQFPELCPDLSPENPELDTDGAEPKQETQGRSTATKRRRSI